MTFPRRREQKAATPTQQQHVARGSILLEAGNGLSKYVTVEIVLTDAAFQALLEGPPHPTLTIHVANDVTVGGS